MSNPLSDVFGSTPRVAPFHKLSAQTEQSKSLLGNIANFADIAKLGDQYKQYMIDSQESLLPGYKDTLALGQKGAHDLLATGEQFLTGELPQDIKDQVYRSSAYTSLMGGYGGSGMAHSLTARDLGLTSLDLMKQGASMIGQGGNSAQQWSSMARGDMMNPASQFISPDFQANFDLQNTILHQNALQNRYNIAAAPDPAAKGISDTIISLIGAYLGAGKGGGGGSIAANSFTPAAFSSGYTPVYGSGGYPSPGGAYGPSTDWSSYAGG